MAMTTGQYSGRHPAIAALIAATSTVQVRPRCSILPMTSSGSRVVCARNLSTSPWVAGTSGSPSDQPLS